MDNPTASPRSAPPPSPPESAGPDSTPDATATGSSAPGSAAGTTSTTTEPPLRPSAADAELLSLAESVELAARDLYQKAIDAGTTDGDFSDMFVAMRESHEEYANSISGILGSPAARRAQNIYDEHIDSFTGDTDALIAAAYDLESTLVATHTSLISTLTGTDAAATLAGAVVVEARHCSALAAAAGRVDDLDLMLVDTATPLTPSDVVTASSQPASSEPVES